MLKRARIKWVLWVTLLWPVLSVHGNDCQAVGWTRKNTTCPKGTNEVYRDESWGPQYLRVCCEPGSDGETSLKRSAPNCRATECLTSTGGDLCSTLDARYIKGKKLRYEEVMRDPCTRGGDGGHGVVSLCCQPNSQEGLLVTSLGAEPNEFPHQAKIKPIDCGGTVYNNRFIITASHCIVDKQGNVKDAKEMKVILGTNIGDMDLNAKEYVYQVKRIIPHEEYSALAKNPKNERNAKQPGWPRTYNDVALLELEKNITFSNTIKSLEIADEDFDPFAYADNAVIVGWGTTETLALAIHLQKANFILRRDPRCFSRRRGKWSQMEGLEKQLLCVGGILDGKFSWTAGGGDSGGPAICRKANGNPVLCGVTSFGGSDDECAKNSDERSCLPSVYAEVAHFHKWIVKHAGDQDSSTFYQPYLYGKEVPASKYQHQVHITSSEGKPCGGTLVRPDVVVTAAQCVMKGDGSNTLFNDLVVTFGVNNLKGGKGKQFGVADVRYLDGFQMDGKPVDVKKQGDRVFLTDNYYNNDLAVVKLDKKTTLKQVKMPEVPRFGEKFYHGHELAFPRNTSRSGQLMSREFKLLDKWECQKRLNRIGGRTGQDINVDENLLCGVEKYSGGSTCDRELGGGLLCKDASGKEKLCGVQTFRLCMLSIPNGFVDMTQYQDWVNTAINEMSG